jgi:hypothetical protein
MKLFLYLAAVLALGGCVAHTQSASDPPIKMGLWEITMDVRRVDPPMFGTYVSQICLTPETWRKFLTGGELSPDCDIHNFKEDASGWSYDLVCKKIPGSFGSTDSSSHLQLLILNPEKMRRTDRGEYIESSGPWVLESLADSIYKGADCKDVAPGMYKKISGS